MLDLTATTDVFRLLGDGSRLRLLALLSQEELAVAELCRITGLTQSRVSTHLGKLKDAGLVVDRRAGGSSFYRVHDGMPDAARQAWQVARTTLTDPLVDDDCDRLEQLLAARSGDASWADSVAGQMARHYSPGRTWESLGHALPGLLSLGRVLDIASGDGAVAELLAPRCTEIVCLDRSERVVTSGRERLAHVPNLRFVQGDMHQIDAPDRAFDAVLLLAALPYARKPAVVLAEALRVLSPGGRLILSTLRRHAHRDAVARFDHVNSGFEPEELQNLLEEAGLTVDFCEVTSRERRRPYLEVVTAYARRPEVS